MKSLFLAVSVALIATLSGCGESRVPAYPTRGTVHFGDGELVKTGIIELESVEHGTTATGRILEDGTFILGTYTPNDGAVAGSHRVIVVQIIVKDGTMKHMINHGRAVPTKYASYDTSGIKTTVEPIENNQLKIVLE